MSQTNPTAVDALPTAPSTTSPSTFATLADAFVAALATFRTQINNIATNVYNNAVDCYNNAVAAASSATASTAAANITKWVSGTSYTEGDGVWSPITFQSYRRKVTGAGTTDPSTDTTNWALIGAIGTAGANLTGGINSARGNITQHATTMNFFAITSPDVLDGTGAAVTITSCVNAPQAGAMRRFYPLAGTVLTHGATFDIAGNANLTAAAGDCWIIEAKTVSTYRVTVEKENGTPLVVATNAEAIAGTDTTKPVTSAGLASSLSKSTAGYVQLPGKILIQWGDFATDANGDGTASYPVTFTGGVAQIVGNDRNGDTARIVTFGAPGLSSTAGYIVDGFGASGVSSTASYIVIGWMA